MFCLQHKLSRRVFLRKTSIWFAVIANSKLSLFGGVAVHEPSVQRPAYGEGIFGADSYPGNRTYLPLINKESN